ncbi:MULTISPECIES: hypothetical protein [Paraburkholderia]|uniref:hypothetical protein n=1 Tax=Paraburkholderia TaxID=1822464 RepID=UPI0012F69155|nr:MULTISPECIES: hypothetical protein [Paraburkholderia]MDR8398909.1 hypothetical protein [Paraburkholderia sp. USG1]
MTTMIAPRKKHAAGVIGVGTFFSGCSGCPEQRVKVSALAVSPVVRFHRENVGIFPKMPID